MSRREWTTKYCIADMKHTNGYRYEVGLVESFYQDNVGLRVTRSIQINGRTEKESWDGEKWVEVPEGEKLVIITLPE